MAPTVSIEVLTPNERMVLDRLGVPMSAKEISTALDISQSAVEERIRSARRKLGAANRVDLTRRYQALLADPITREGHSDAVPRFEGVGMARIPAEELVRELRGGPRYSLHDAQGWAQWSDYEGRRRTLLETFDDAFGWPGRLVLVAACFVLVCLALGQIFDVAAKLNMIM